MSVSDQQPSNKCACNKQNIDFAAGSRNLREAFLRVLLIWSEHNDSSSTSHLFSFNTNIQLTSCEDQYQGVYLQGCVPQQVDSCPLCASKGLPTHPPREGAGGPSECTWLIREAAREATSQSDQAVTQGVGRPFGTVLGSGF